MLGLPVPLHERFDTQRLFTERMVVIFPPDHRFEATAAVPFSELAGERYLDRLNCEFRDAFFELLEERGIEITVPYRSEREDWIQNMVAQGMGLCLIPENSISVSGLQVRPVIEPDLSRHVDVVTVAGRQRSPALQAFIKEAAGYTWPD
jgi:LysR family hydrogen peroxide-inducible transcriptional activator